MLIPSLKLLWEGGMPSWAEPDWMVGRGPTMYRAAAAEVVLYGWKFCGGELLVLRAYGSWYEYGNMELDHG